MKITKNLHSSQKDILFNNFNSNNQCDQRRDNIYNYEILESLIKAVSFIKNATPSRLVNTNVRTKSIFKL